MIWGIGLPKTGTASLCRALTQLGFRTQHHSPFILESLQRDFRGLDAIVMINPFDFPIFAKLYPHSRFIYTERDCDSWLESAHDHMNVRHRDRTGTSNYWRLRLFGAIHPTREEFLSTRARLEQLINSHFRDHPQDLLKLRINEGEGWNQLCPFLQKPIVDAPFPRANVSPRPGKVAL